MRDRAAEIGARVVSLLGRGAAPARLPRSTCVRRSILTRLIYSRPEAWLSWHTLAAGRSSVEKPARTLSCSVCAAWRSSPLAISSPARRATAAEAGAGRSRRLSRCWEPVDAAAAVRRAPPVPFGSTTFQEVYELSAIGAPNGITLEGVGVSQNLFFGVPLTKIITNATLGLRYTSRMPSDGALVLWLNGTRLATVRFTPGTDLQAGGPAAHRSADHGQHADAAARELRRLRRASSSRDRDRREEHAGHRRLETPAAERPVAAADSVCPIRQGERSWQLPMVFASAPRPCHAAGRCHRRLVVRRVFGRSRCPVSGPRRRSSRRQRGGARVERFQPGGAPVRSEAIRIVSSPCARIRETRTARC